MFQFACPCQHKESVIIQNDNQRKSKSVSCKCGECGKSFVSIHTLGVHIREVHQKLRPHKCGECGKSFCRPSILRRHVQTVHVNKELNAACDNCSKFFVAKGFFEKLIDQCQHQHQLKSHHQTVPAKDQDHACLGVSMDVHQVGPVEDPGHCRRCCDKA